MKTTSELYFRNISISLVYTTKYYNNNNGNIIKYKMCQSQKVPRLACTLPKNNTISSLVISRHLKISPSTLKLK